MENKNSQSGNNAESKAIDFVIKHEKDVGRNPKNVSKTRCGCDILSNSRKIEVKGASSSAPPFALFNQYNFKALQKESNFWLYIVYNLKDKPKLLTFSKNEILKRSRFTYAWEIPLRKADFIKK